MTMLKVSLRKSFSLRRTLLLSTVITSGVLASNVALAGCADTANATTCSNGTASDDMFYVPESEVYVAGDFVLTLDNYDVTGGVVAVVGSLEEEAVDGDDDVVALQGNGTININNDSDVVNVDDPSVGVLSFRNATININSATSRIVAEGDTDFTVGAYAVDNDGVAGGNALITTVAGSLIKLDSSEPTNGEHDDNSVAAIQAQADSGDVTVSSNGIVESSHTGILAQSQTGDVSVTATGNVTGGRFGYADSPHGGIVARAEHDFDDDEISEEDALDQIYSEAPSHVTVNATGNVKGNYGILATTDIGNATVTTGAGTITGDALGVGVGAEIKGNVSIATGTGDVEATGAVDEEEESESTGIGSKIGDEELYLGERETGGNITVATGGNVKGGENGIWLGTVNGDISVTTVGGKQTTGTNDTGIAARVGFAEEFYSDFSWQQFFASGGEGDIEITANGKVNGGWRGIDAWTRSGDVAVTTNGAVVGLENDGIKAESGIADFWFYATPNQMHVAEGEGDVIVNANNNVTGGRNGINAWTHSGDATVNVAASAVVKGLGTEEFSNADGVRVQAGFNNTADMMQHFSGGGGNVAADIRGTVEGLRHGVNAWTFEGDATVKTAATAKVIGKNENGIQAEAGVHYFDDELNTVIGGENGGGGNVLVEAGGEVTGNRFGIFAWTNNGNTTVSTLANTKITGGTESGILAEAGTAYFDNPTAGYLSFGSGDAIVDVAVGSTVEGSREGISAFARDGIVKVTTAADSTVTGTEGHGINVNSGQAETGLSETMRGTIGPIFFDDGIAVEVNAGGTVTGAESGIQANVVKGSATVSTTATSNITGNGEAGIDVTAGRYRAEYGGGTVTVDAAGQTTGRWAGIAAGNRDGNVFVTTRAGSKTTGLDGNGINANAGDDQSEEETGGNVTVLNGGEATGLHNGISAWSNSGWVAVTTGSTSKSLGSGDESAGINAYTNIGDVTVTNGGLAEGNWTGVFVGSNEGSMKREITNLATGIIRNSSLDLYATAIEIGGNFVDELERSALRASNVENLGRVDGTIRLNGFGNIENAGVWNTLGEDNYAEDGDIMNAAAGRINAAHSAATAEATMFSSATFHNSGLMSIADALSGSGNTVQDKVYIRAETYSGGGTVALNAYLNDVATSTADQFIVMGNATGNTVLRVVNTNSGGGAFIDEAAGEGILLAIVEGTATADAFTLEGGSISTGLYDYYLVAGTTNAGPESRATSVATSYELFSRPNDGSAVDSVQIASGANGVWSETTDVWEDRQDNLRGGSKITAVSSDGIQENSSPGSVWLQGLYGKVDHKGSSSFNGRVVDTGFDQNVTGLVGGLDMGTELSSGGRLLFGIVGGFTASDVKFAARTNSMKFDGYSLGAYASFMQDGFFANALLKGEFLDMKHTVGAASGKTNVNAIGVRADAGYRMGYGPAVIEPLVSLSYVNTSVDSYTVGLTNFGSSSSDSLNAGAGARVTYSTDALSLSMTGRVWNNFSDTSKVDVTVGTGATTSAAGEGAFSGMYGELSSSVSANLSESVTLYGGGSLKIDSDTSSKTVFGGLNVQF